jgi:hypothetical protein
MQMEENFGDAGEGVGDSMHLITHGGGWGEERVKTCGAPYVGGSLDKSDDTRRRRWCCTHWFEMIEDAFVEDEDTIFDKCRATEDNAPMLLGIEKRGGELRERSDVITWGQYEESDDDDDDDDVDDDDDDDDDDDGDGDSSEFKAFIKV